MVAMMVELTFGEWLQDRLVEAKMEQQELAALVGRSPSTVSKWIANKNTPYETTCDRIAEALGIDPDEVRRRAGHRPRPQFITPKGIGAPGEDRDDLVRAVDELSDQVRLSAERIAGLEAQIERLLKEREDKQD